MPAAGRAPPLHIATHLSNLIKVSDRVTVRHSAGNALLALAPRLTADQRNEVAVELCRGLELGQQEFTKYIPDYLGRFALWLPPAELDEVLADLHVNLSSSDSRVTASVLDTVGVIYEELRRLPLPLPGGRTRPIAAAGSGCWGLLLRGAQRASTAPPVRRRCTCWDGGCSAPASWDATKSAVPSCSPERKLLSAQNEFPGEGLTFYYRAAMLGKLYRFLTEERLFHRGFRLRRAPARWPSSPAPSTPSPCPTRASSRPSATWAMR